MRNPSRSAGSPESMAPRIARAAVVLLVAASFGSTASAQTGALIVVVSDADGAPLPGATVTIRHEQSYVAETALLTDRQGRAEFPVLRPTGTTGLGYAVTVAMPGFATHRVADLKVRLGQATVVPVQLSEELVERVKVVAQSDVVDLDETAQTTKFSADFVQDLPVPGRFYQNMLTLAPGVQDADGDGNPNVHGGRERDFKAVVSGVANVDPLTGQRMFEVNPNSIEEIEVISAGAGVEFRRAQGGFARILQKQGSNDFDGLFEMYYRSDLFDGDGARSASDIETPGFESYQPAVQVSGPIVKDRLWYRLSHSVIHDEDPVNIADGIAVITDERRINSDQITWQASARNKLSLHLQSDPRTIENFGVSSSVSEESSERRETGTRVYGLTWTAPYSPRVLVESQVVWQDLSFDRHPMDPHAPVRCLSGAEFLGAASCTDRGTSERSGPLPFDLADHRQRLTVRGDATLYGGRWLGMTHQLRMGISMENERFHRELTLRPVLEVFLHRFADGDPADPRRTAEIRGDIPVPGTARIRATGVTGGFYVEDQIKPRSNLTVTLGLGVDHEQLGSDGNGTFDPSAEYADYGALLAAGVPPQIALQSTFTAYESQSDFFHQLAAQLGLPYEAVFRRQTTAAQQSSFWDHQRRADNIQLSNTNVSPFLGVAWDPAGNGKTRIAASARRYYGHVYLAIPLGEIDSASASVAFRGLPRTDADGRETWVVDPADPLLESISPSVNVDAVDRGLETPYTDELALSFEREIATETSVRLSWIRRRARQQFQDVDLNHVPLDLGRCRRASLVAPQPIAPVVPGDAGYDPALAPGDGRVDDCAGRFDLYDNDPADEHDDMRLERADGIADLYVQNPGWGNVLLLGNLNSSDYEGVSLELTRRQYRNWELHGSYTWSRALGDGEDYNQPLGDDRTLVEDERGYQSNDRRHQLTVSATTITPWGFRLGGVVRWQSGLPYSILHIKDSFDAIPPTFSGLGAEGTGRTRATYPTGVRNSERNPGYWNVDLRLTRELRLAPALQAQLSAEVFNLFNDDTFQVYNASTDSGQQINGSNDGFYRFGRRWQLGAKLTF